MAELRAAARPGGGWSYTADKASRLEPTCWALVALGLTDAAQAPHRAFLEKCQRPDGWLAEAARWPVNIAFNALTAFTWLSDRRLASDERLERLLAALATSKGVQAPQSPTYVQDNSLQGWSWTDATFSWVEPTAWGVLALKKAARTSFVADATRRARVMEGERVLLDRACRDGGWNFGNANVMGQDLYPHVPTSALALIALQDRRDQPVVARSVAFLETHWPEEDSLFALGLSLIALRLYGRPHEALATRLQEHLATRRLGNLHGFAIAITALAFPEHEAAFRI